MLLVNAMYNDVIQPFLARYPNVYAFVTATARAVPLMERTEIPSIYLMKQFYSEASFQLKVVDYLKAQETGCYNRFKA